MPNPILVHRLVYRKVTRKNQDVCLADECGESFEHYDNDETFGVNLLNFGCGWLGARWTDPAVDQIIVARDNLSTYAVGSDLASATLNGGDGDWGGAWARVL